MIAIIKVESGGNPLAININGSRRLTRQPRSKAEAQIWSEWLINRGYSIDMGLAQINSTNLSHLGVSVANMFDPCINIAAGARILTDNYAGAAQRYGQGQNSLQAALSAYNTGNHRAGFANGYVSKVTNAAHPGLSAKAHVPLFASRASLTRPLRTALDSHPTATHQVRYLKQDLRDKGNPVSARVFWVKP